MRPATLLVVDDEPQIRRVLRSTLSAQGYTIAEAGDGQDALEKLSRVHPDLILLDMNMPVLDGLETCREIRTGSDVPIIMLTVRSAEKDKVRALDAGADDYVVKPFGMEELLARIRAALRRTASGEPLVLSAGGLELDFENRTFRVRGRAVHVTPKEFEVLRELARNLGRPVTHRRLLQAAWGAEYGDETESLRVVINQLRRKVEADPAKPRYIRTEPWIGYRLVLAGWDGGAAPRGAK